MFESVLILFIFLFLVMTFVITRASIFHMVFILFAAFPYFILFGVGTNTDIQIYPFVLGTFISVTGLWIIKWKLNFTSYLVSFFRYTVMLFILVLLTTLVRSFRVITPFILVRCLMPYASIAVLPIASYISFLKCGIKRIESLLKFSYYIWSAVGVIQIWIPDFMNEMKNRLVGGGGRGTVSLAPEPAYFAVQLLLINLILLQINPKKNKLTIFFSLFVIMFIAKSATGTFYVLCFLIIFYLTRKMIFPLVGGSILAVALLLMLQEYFVNTRIIYLFEQIIANPQNVIIADASLNSRVTEWVFTSKGFLENWLMPRGVLEWAQYRYSQEALYPWLFWGRASTVGNWNKTSTQIGALLFEAGIFAIPLLLFLKKLSKKITGSYRWFIFVMILSINSLNYTTPLFSVLLGYMFYSLQAKSIAEENHEKASNQYCNTHIQRRAVPAQMCRLGTLTDI